MSEANIYRGLRFGQHRWYLSRRLIPIVVVMSIFILLWKFTHHNLLFWLLVPSLAILAWVCSYGWRQALAALITFLIHIEQL